MGVNFISQIILEANKVVHTWGRFTMFKKGFTLVSAGLSDKVCLAPAKAGNLFLAQLRLSASQEGQSPRLCSLMWESFPRTQILFALVLTKKSHFLSKRGNHTRCEGPSAYPPFPVTRGKRLCYSLWLQSIWKVISSGMKFWGRWNR